MALEKTAKYSSTNTYTTCNKMQATTKNVWLVFHGMGYLSKYFARYFTHLDPAENFIIIPQAPSKYYIGPSFKHVGASWLTRENTVQETENVLNYVDAVWKAEKPSKMPQFIVLGYSQGVSIAMRWLAKRSISCDALLLHSGGIPKELNASHFKHLPNHCKVTYLYGDKDEYITEAKKTEQTLKSDAIFGTKLSVEVFKGIHEVNTAFIKEFAEK
ncbi:esterase [Rasiella rasia]|uniref:Esterase n=1 Tax=Rasiella rasia TaxID=2744027 RepID=A0A6G6GHJ8_9FLAO|nr:esterase [Rasiella rasia]QIE58066.1 esterase [Rasiella rasia]